MKNKKKMKMIRKSFSFNPHPDFSNISKNKTHALNQEKKTFTYGSQFYIHILQIT